MRQISQSLYSINYDLNEIYKTYKPHISLQLRLNIYDGLRELVKIRFTFQ